MKTGVLFAASAGDGAASAWSNLQRLARQRPWGAEVRWGTLAPPRAPLRRPGHALVALPQALRQLQREGFSHVAVQPLCVIGGAEYARLQATVARAQGGPAPFAQLAVGAPLLSSAADLTRVAAALRASVDGARARGDALIAVGHGSAEPPGEMAYLALDRVLGDLDRRAFVGCVRGRPDRDDVTRSCRACGARRALLLPLTAAAGATVRAAFAGTGAGSWVAALAEAGIEGIPLLRGLGENDGVAEVWLDHLQAAWKALAPTPRGAA